MKTKFVKEIYVRTISNS